MPHTTGPSQPMAQESNTPRQNRTYRPYTHMGHKESNPLRALLCNIPNQLVPPCSLPKTRSPLNNQNLSPTLSSNETAC